MSVELPEPIAAFFAAENGEDPEPPADCFVHNAVVRDEARTIEGLSAIKKWKASHSRVQLPARR